MYWSPKRWRGLVCLNLGSDRHGWPDARHEEERGATEPSSEAAATDPTRHRRSGGSI
jgi:hypothetical protein